MDERQERKNLKKAKERERLAKINRDKFIEAALSTREGREYFYWLLATCRVGQQPYTGNALNTAFACGELNIGQQVQAHIIEVSPSMFLRMLTEKEEERKNDDRDTDPDASGNADADPDTEPLAGHAG